MFCTQCEQTMVTPAGSGCAYSQGMCGKTAEVSDLQDVLVYNLKGISFWADLGRKYQVIDKEADIWVPMAFFSTLTNVNFDAQRILDYARTAQKIKSRLKENVVSAITLAGKSVPTPSTAALFELPETAAEILAVADQAAVNIGKDEVHPDVIGLRLLCLYGLKGAAAYMEHARVLGQTDEEVAGEFHRIMGLLGTDPEDIDLLFDTAMKIGMLNYKVMAMLDEGETSTYGHPQPTQVNTKPVKGKCILVSGHDLHDLKLILEQTQGTGINVYTHGEMLPALAYPELKKYSHLVGNFGGAWYAQQSEFAKFPGPIVMTSNCIIDPNVGQYADRIFTRNIVGWPGVQHIVGDDMSDVIKCAQECKGFPYDEIEYNITIGFGRNALTEAVPAVMEQIKAGNIKHFYLIGGCDGDRQERKYYKDFALSTGQDSLLLTLGCGKYRFNKIDFGDINGIPRLLDLGQCNDAYSAIQLAILLAKNLDCDINELPLTLVLSWFEQKAIVILLTLLALGVKGVYTGPTMPAFLTENLVNILKEKLDLHGTTTVEADLAAIAKA